SPWTTRDTQRPYWTKNGWSSPSCSRSAEKSRGVAIGPRRICAGSPGARGSARNTTNEMPTRTKAAETARWARYRRMGGLRPEQTPYHISTERRAGKRGAGLCAVPPRRPARALTGIGRAGTIGRDRRPSAHANPLLLASPHRRLSLSRRGHVAEL